MTLMLTFDLDLGDLLFKKVKVKEQVLCHYLAKLLKRFSFAQNVFTFTQLSERDPWGYCKIKGLWVKKHIPKLLPW